MDNSQSVDQSKATVSETVAPAAQVAQQQVVSANPQGMSNDTKTIITVILLIFAYPIGAILALFWVKWPLWVRIIVALPLVLIIVGIVLVFVLAALNPSAQISKAKYMSECAKTYTSEECSKMYLDDLTSVTSTPEMPVEENTEQTQ